MMEIWQVLLLVLYLLIGVVIFGIWFRNADQPGNSDSVNFGIAIVCPIMMFSWPLVPVLAIIGIVQGLIAHLVMRHR